MIRFIEKYATTKVVVILFVLMLLCIGMMTYIGTIFVEMGFTETILDLRMPLITIETMQSVLGSYGKEGREFYRFLEMTADIIYPIVYSFFYSFLIAWLLLKTNLRNTKFRFLPLIPLIGLILDFFENIGIINAIDTYPKISGMGATMPYFGMFKWIFAFITMSSIFILLSYWLLKKSRIKTT